MQGSAYPLVDLLQAVPTWRVDPELLDTKLVFSFSGSSSGGLFSDTLAVANLPESTWQSTDFVRELFVERMVRECFQGPQSFSTFRHLVQIVAHPPRSGASIELRRQILKELLEIPHHADRLKSLHGALTRFRTLMEGTGQGERLDAHRQQLDILAAFSEVVEIMSGFADCTSPLRRLHEFAREVSEGEGYQSLLGLLSYDGKLATLDFRVQVGADGRVRELELLTVREDYDNAFVNSPLRRWAAKWELLFRGFRFGDSEVMARLLDAVFEGVRRYFVALVPLLGDVEVYLGALHFKARSEAAGLPVCLPSFVESTQARRLEGLFNPLLLFSGTQPIACNIETDRLDTILLITGPNSGGKTRLLQALGLTQVLAEGGFFVPARRAQLASSPGIVVSLMQETSADQTEGRLGTELLRIRALFEQLPVGATVILDELCSGTNPSEGEEIFELVMKMLEKLRPQAFVTTHFLKFAARLATQKNISALRFLQVQLGERNEPTYQFVEGVAKTSLANHAATRLGVTGEQLLALIDRKLKGSH